jgi:hypothetical protein
VPGRMGRHVLKIHSECRGNVHKVVVVGDLQWT